MINLNKPEGKKLLDAFKILTITPEGQMVLQYLQAMFLYPNPGLAKYYGLDKFTNDEILGHHRVILHILSLLDQEKD